MEQYDELIDSLLYCDSNEEVQEVAKKYNSIIVMQKEKVHALHYNYHYIINNEVSVLIESSIDVGTIVRDIDYYSNSISTTKDVPIINVVFDFEEFGRKHNKELLPLALSIFEREKPDIEEMIRKQSYDNYVTGGGTITTDTHHKNEAKKFVSLWTTEIEYITADRRFI